MKRRVEHELRVLGDNVKALRRAMSLSQEDLALQAEVDRTYVSQIERAVGNPSVLVLFKISEVLGVELAALFTKQK